MIDTSKKWVCDNLRASMHGPVRRRSPYAEMARALFWGISAGVLAWTVAAATGGIIVGTGVASVLWIQACRKAQRGE